MGNKYLNPGSPSVQTLTIASHYVQLYAVLLQAVDDSGERAVLHLAVQIRKHHYNPSAT